MLLTLDEIDAQLDIMALQSDTRYQAARHEACFAIARKRIRNRLGYVDINATFAQYQIHIREYDDMQILHDCHELRLFDRRGYSDIDDCVCIILARHLPLRTTVDVVGEALAVLHWERLKLGMIGTCAGQGECSVCLQEVEFGARIIRLECSHWFHPMCILSWLREKRSCPLCRHNVLSC